MENATVPASTRDKTVQVSDDTTSNPLPTSFHDLGAYVALPRVSGLTLAPDGSRLVTSVATPDADGHRYVTALWEVDPAGERPARRLTRSGKGESGAAFTPEGDLLFTSSRPDPESGTADEDAGAALWLLPRDGAEAHIVARRTPGVNGAKVATQAGTVLLTSDVLRSARDLDHDEEIRTSRKERKVSAILHDSYPVRRWDHDLGPASPHLLTSTAIPGAPDGTEDAPGSAAALRDLTPGVHGALRDQSFDVTADGATVVTGWTLPAPGAAERSILVTIDVATGERRELLSIEGADVLSPVVSPDGTQVAFLHETDSSPTTAPRYRLGLVPLAGGEHRLVAGDWDRWPSAARWLPDGSGLLVTADDDGRSPVFRIDLADAAHDDGQDAVTHLTRDDFAYSDLRVHPGGEVAFALRSSYAAPPHPVRIDLRTGATVPLPGPAPLPELPGRLTEVETTVADGRRIRAWLALPDGASAADPAPLLLWIHGGPLGSWNAWSWRWNPWLLVAQGYAVLLPDPALSTGYGQDFIQAGWGAWGQAPYTDLMAITDVAEARADIDAERTAAMGGSFGGYMANWVAGHTDRFRAIVTHASLWALDQFGPTTDASFYWLREMTDEMAHANSPHRFVSDIVTPMLVIHGDKDYRVPIGEGLRLWYELLTDSGLPADDEGRTVHRFLYFPEENHWVLTPQHAEVWYQSVTAFLAEHVLGQETGYPEILG